MPVYFIRAVDGTGPVKIGWTKNPSKRLAEIQRMSPTPLALLNVVDGDHSTEKRLHSYFAGLRLYGEWFDPDERLVEFITRPVEVSDLPPQPSASKSEHRKCSGYTLVGNYTLSPCYREAIEGSDYCRVCNKKKPKGIPKDYLKRQQKQPAPRCKGVTLDGRQCPMRVRGKEYCRKHDPSRKQCEAILPDGRQCFNLVGYQGWDYCQTHQTLKRRAATPAGASEAR